LLTLALLTLWTVSAPVAGSSLYLLALVLLSKKARPPPPSTRLMRFDIIIPAHNEEAGIAAVVRSALEVDWPVDLFRVVVVADNCNDATAEQAARCGAQVLVRQNDELRGKGYALSYAFHESQQGNWADAVVVVDADSKVSVNLLEAIAARMELGEQAVQVHYGVSNIHASWRTRMMSIAMAAFHRVRSRGRERLGLSCGIRGNGWSLTHALLRKVPYASYSLTEDLEYGIELGSRGVRVAYADEASCDGEMVSREQDARSQRRRWEQGRIALLRENALPLLKRAFVARSVICLDLALDLLVLPLSYIVLGAAAMASGGWFLATIDPAFESWAWAGGACCVALTLYVLRGWQLSGAGIRGLVDLLRAPFFLLWKVALMFRSRRTSEWVRTNREGR
jgi:cellulose synthase/poly-beta-1,6-N-acetylglucosamine synthase-like glycosyltransferase